MVDVELVLYWRDVSHRCCNCIKKKSAAGFVV